MVSLHQFFLQNDSRGFNSTSFLSRTQNGAFFTFGPGSRDCLNSGPQIQEEIHHICHCPPVQWRLFGFYGHNWYLLTNPFYFQHTRIRTTVLHNASRAIWPVFCPLGFSQGVSTCIGSVALAWNPYTLMMPYFNSHWEKGLWGLKRCIFRNQYWNFPISDNIWVWSWTLVRPDCSFSGRTFKHTKVCVFACFYLV